MGRIVLAARDIPLYFFSRDNRDDASERMEIDFLVANGETRRSNDQAGTDLRGVEIEREERSGTTCG